MHTQKYDMHAYEYKGKVSKILYSINKRDCLRLPWRR